MSGSEFVEAFSFLAFSLKPLGFVLATGLHPLVFETASLLSKCLCIRSAANRMMSLLQELLLIKITSSPRHCEERSNLLFN
jgi:hypothetical protein